MLQGPFTTNLAKKTAPAQKPSETHIKQSVSAKSRLSKKLHFYMVIQNPSKTLVIWRFPAKAEDQRDGGTERNKAQLGTDKCKPLVKPMVRLS